VQGPVPRWSRACGVASVLVILLSGGPAAASNGIPDEVRDAWLALLHYRGTEGRWRSEVREPSFFLDAAGSTQPEREWEASRRAFTTPDPASAEHARCRFPARFTLMKHALGWSEQDLPAIDCPTLDAYLREVRAESLSAVFVSHYLNNPASAFGHTMLYLGRASDERAVLANHSVSFEADVEGMTPMGYIPRGLAGGLVAQFRVARLHERVRKYERHEQRDLWLFPLRVTQEEIDQLVRHLWELKDVQYTYGFFGDNCAQKLLALVHAIAPQYELLPLRSPAVLPSDVVVRLVDRIGPAGEPTYRPSTWSRYSRLVAELDAGERQQLEQMISSKIVLADASPAALSAALLWSELNAPYRAFRREAERTDHPDLRWRRSLWSARIAHGDPAEIAIEGHGRSLLAAHGPSRLTLRGIHHRGGDLALGLGARWLLHDALDPHAGYPPLSTLEVARLDVAMTSSGDLQLDELTGLRLERLAPASTLQSPLAWKFEAGARRLPHDGDSPLHVGAEVAVGAGTAVLASRHTVALYTMVGLRPGVVLSEDRRFLLAGLWTGGLLLRLPSDVRARVAAEAGMSVSSREGAAAAVSTVVRKGLARNWDIELASRFGSGPTTTTLGLVMFR
jgi:hypothetical protein